MNIDLDSNRATLPPWDLTIKYQGKIRPVKQPTNEQLLKLATLKNVPMVEGYGFAIDTFKKLTGISDEIMPGELQTFFHALATYIGTRMKVTREKRDKALARAAAAVQRN